MRVFYRRVLAALVGDEGQHLIAYDLLAFVFAATRADSLPPMARQGLLLSSRC